jgi:hypothetical protein
MATEKEENNATSTTKSFSEIQIEGSARRAGTLTCVVLQESLIFWSKDR